MNKPYPSKIVFLLGLVIGLVSINSLQASELYNTQCASCHGKNLSGGLGPSLIAPTSNSPISAEAIAKTINNGITDTAMPAFKSTLTDADVRALVIYIQEQRNDGKSDTAKKAGAKRSLSGKDFSLTTVAQHDGQMWSMTFIDNDNALFTQVDGGLYQLKKGKLSAIKNSPTGWAQGQGGLLDVYLHPDYKNNDWIYLSLSESADNKKGMTKIIRGKIKKEKWVNEENIFSAHSDLHSSTKYHFGSRIAIIDNYIYFGFGDRGHKELAQDLTRPNGKIFRLHDDGRIPKDNPFYHQADAMQAIWSYGHRNPQGMTIDNKGRLWSAEHGPRGGDEINLIQKGVNYGWPLITYGMNYDGSPITAHTHAEGMAQPAWFWVPSIAVSDIEFYASALFPGWQGKLLAASLSAEELQLLSINDDKVQLEKPLLKGLGQIRDVHVTDDGRVYLLLVNDKKTDIVYLSPPKD